VSEPSEDALAMAREHADNGNDERALAAAFQRLMDHIDKVEALADKQHGALKEALERWEQAKRRYDAAGAVVLGFKERAEKAEAKLADALVRSLKLIDERDTLRVRLAVADDRAERAERVLADEREWYAVASRDLAEANARLAELVREVREWNSDYHGDALLGVILAKHEGGEHG
jgi:chromosome segregation ATPase